MSVQKASDSDSGGITAEQENVTNIESDSINSVMRCFLQSGEETLEEMVGGFLYLTMDDFKNSIPVCETLKNQATFGNDDQGKNCTSDTHSPGVVSLVHLISSQTKAVDAGLEEEVEEETLGANCMQLDGMLHRRRPPSLTKFDNFVLTEDREAPNEVNVDDELLITSGYLASFGTENTDGEVVRDKTPTTSVLEHHGSTTKDRFCQLSDALSLSSQNDLEGSIEDEAVENEMLSSSEFSCCALMVGDAEARCAATSRCQQPGEVEDDTPPPVIVPTLHVLEISTLVTRAAAAPEGVPHSLKDTEWGDEVVPFVLDPDFDYDIVACTPKFTEAEMEYLASFLPRT